MRFIRGEGLRDVNKSYRTVEQLRTRKKSNELSASKHT